jgi:hypothetical protein
MDFIDDSSFVIVSLLTDIWMRERPHVTTKKKTAPLNSAFSKLHVRIIGISSLKNLEYLAIRL